MGSSNIEVQHTGAGFVTAQVVRAERISPSFVRLTVSGEELGEWHDLGFDQWFRLALPVAGDATRFDRLAKRFDMRGYLKYLTLPKATRPEIRNYTVREFRRETLELDIDFVVHGTDAADPAHAGVAGPWAAALPIGERVALIDQGCGYRHRENADRVVLVGDESAMPAVIGILRDLPRDAVGDAIIELPHEDDRQGVEAPAGVRVQWIVRDTNASPGDAALQALQALPHTAGSVSAFVAGEQRLATGGRRHLVSDRGVDKHAVDFCGYWRAN